MGFLETDLAYFAQHGLGQDGVIGKYTIYADFK